MRILFLQGGFGSGGAEKIVALLAAHRADMGDEVHVAAIYCPPEGSYYSYPNNVTLHVPHDKICGPVQWQRFRQIRRLHQTLKPDVIVSFLTKVNVLALIAVAGSKRPVIISERNNPFVQGGRQSWTHLQSLLAPRAFAVVLQTKRLKNAMGSRVEKNGVVIPNPCEPPCSDWIKHDLRNKRLVAVGRLAFQKGFDDLIDAMLAVIERHPDATLKIFGDGPLRGELAQQIRANGLEDTVTLAGVSKKPGSWISEADLFVATSRYEGFPNVIAEAAVAGLPTIATDCDYGPRELIRHGVNGYLTPVSDKAAFSEAVINTLDNPDGLAGLTQEAEKLRSRLAQDKILTQWDDLIEHAAAGCPEQKNTRIVSE